MNVLKTARVALATGVIVAAGSSMASAEIVYLTSGRTLSVKGHTEAGESIVLSLRAGGDVTLDKTLVEKIIPDEVPHPDPAPVVVADQDAQALGQLTQAAAPQRTSLLRDTTYADLIASAAEAHGVDPILVQALIQVESNYQARARSPKGAMGLMQLMPSVAREYKVRNAYDPKANIDAGVRKLKSLLEKYGTDSLDLVLAAYNAGEGAIQRFGGIPPYRETRNYVSRILGIVGLK